MKEVSAMVDVPDTHADLLDGEFATLATVGPDGRPQLSEVWFLADNGSLRFSLNTSRQKVKNLASDPACAVLLLDLVNPYRYLEIRGDADLEPDDDYVFAGRVGARYGVDLRRHDRPGEVRVVVTVHPVTINAVDMTD
jgi:PPOX class probable F420-dependent enzyme